MHFVKFHPEVTSFLLSRGKRKYSSLGMRLLWKYIKKLFSGIPFNFTVFSSCNYGVQWAYVIPLYLSVYLSIYLSIYPSTIRKNASSWICLDRFSWYLDIMIIRWRDNRGVQEFGVKDHVRVIWSRRSNMLKTILRLHDSIDFDETWVKRSLAGGSFGVFRKFWSEAVLGSLGVAFDHWVFNLLKTAAKVNVSVSHMISAWVNTV